MKLRQRLYDFKNLYQDANAWDVLRADSAWWALAFLQEMFADKADVEYSIVQAALDEMLTDLRDSGELPEASTTARGYLRNWIDRGWLRESEQMLTRTDATMVAIHFLNSLERRDTTTSASHLAIAQTMARELAIALSPNIQERIALLRAQREEIDGKIADLNAGHVEKITETDHRERVRALFGQCYRLLQDFRRVESDMEEMDRDIRQKLMDTEGGRGVAVAARLEGERALSSTEAGQAFNGFFDLLTDENRRGEFSDQLASIVELTPDDMLNSDEQRLLRRLDVVLNGESLRVFDKRQATNENLRRVIQSGAFTEKRRIDQLINALGLSAMALIRGGLSPRVDTGLAIAAGKPTRSHPMTMRAYWPEDIIDTSAIEPVAFDEDDIDDEVLRHLSSINTTRIASEIQSLVRNGGPMSLLELATERPIRRGLEELVAYIRIAQGIAAPELDERQLVPFCDDRGNRFQARVYKYLLSDACFPERIEDIGL